MTRFCCGLLAVAAVLAGAGAAEAHWRGGGGVYVGIAPPLYAPAYPYHRPHYYSPPAYYAPPPAATEGCYAGPYVCPLDGPAAVGAPCACSTGRGQAWGRAR